MYIYKQGRFFFSVCLHLKKNYKALLLTINSLNTLNFVYMMHYSRRLNIKTMTIVHIRRHLYVYLFVVRIYNRPFFLLKLKGTLVDIYFHQL